MVKVLGEEDSIKLLTALLQEIWRTRSWASDRKHSVYVPIPKKGDARECTNNRTIALTCHVSKILLKVIQRRTQPHIEIELPVEQAGFR